MKHVIMIKLATLWKLNLLHIVNCVIKISEGWNQQIYHFLIECLLIPYKHQNILVVITRAEFQMEG